MRYITRTIKSVIAVCKVYNTVTDEVEDCTLSLGNIPDTKIEAEATKQLKGTDLKFIKLVGATNEENKYKMFYTKY